MRHSRIMVFSACISALAIMTFLSALVGTVFPTLISKKYTQFIVSALFLFFGFKMLLEAYKMTGKEAQEEVESVSLEIDKNTSSEEIEKVEQGLIEEEKRDISLFSIRGPWTLNRIKKMIRMTLLIILSPIWIEAFVMTFLAEWGDRSQIATIVYTILYIFISCTCTIGISRSTRFLVGYNWISLGACNMYRSCCCWREIISI